MSAQPDIAQPGIAPLHQLSLDEYHRMIEAGAFNGDARIELLQGLLVEMSPKSREHENVIEWLAHWLSQGLDAKVFRVRVSAPLTLADSEPEPDIAVIRIDTPRPYHPATAALVVEVAVSSLPRDLGPKRALYAAAGIAEYWVLDLRAARLIVHRGPSKTSGYVERLEFGAGEMISMSTLGLPDLALRELLAAASDPL